MKCTARASVASKSKESRKFTTCKNVSPVFIIYTYNYYSTFSLVNDTRPDPDTRVQGEIHVVVTLVGGCLLHVPPTDEVYQALSIAKDTAIHMI
jgi:hypothetical protein